MNHKKSIGPQAKALMPSWAEYQYIEIASTQITYTKRAHTMNYKAHLAIRALSYSLSDIQDEILSIMAALVAEQFVNITACPKKISISCEVKK